MKRQLQAGFTVIELLVVTAIIIVVSAVVLANNNKFGGRVLLENLAYDIALTMRQAQEYGIATQRSSANNFSSGYGMHFELANPATYFLFADTASIDGMYETGEDVAPSPYTISRGYYISNLCATPTGGNETCGWSKLDIYFKRPEPDAWISVGGTSCILSTIKNTDCQASARIVVTSPRADTMSIIIQADGQITVQ